MNKRTVISRVGFFFYSPQDGYVLLHKRDEKAPTSPNKWDYFGGTIEPTDKGVKEALLREIYEELGVRIGEGELKQLLVSANEKVYFVLFPKKHTPKLKLGEGAGFAWHSFEEAYSLHTLTPDAKRYLEILQKKVSSYAKD